MLSFISIVKRIRISYVDSSPKHLPRYKKHLISESLPLQNIEPSADPFPPQLAVSPQHVHHHVVKSFSYIPEQRASLSETAARLLCLGMRCPLVDQVETAVPRGPGGGDVRLAQLVQALVPGETCGGGGRSDETQEVRSAVPGHWQACDAEARSDGSQKSTV